MEKVEILFPEPQLRRLRELARAQDRSVSELIRSATERWMDQAAAEYSASVREEPPAFEAGDIKVGSERFRELATT